MVSYMRSNGSMFLVCGSRSSMMMSLMKKLAHFVGYAIIHLSGKRKLSFALQNMYCKVPGTKILTAFLKYTPYTC